MEGKRSTLKVGLGLLGKMPSLFLGLFLYAVGILLTIKANLGVSPWDVFHIGLTKHTPLSLGQASQVTGFVIIGLSVFLGLVPGVASVFNMIFIGLFLDLIAGTGLISTPAALPLRLLMLFGGLVVIGWASFFYLRVRLGAGPRDSLMEGLVRKSRLPVWTIRLAIEATVLAAGWFMGGPVGIGTLAIAGLVGLSVQAAFRIGGYDPREGRHDDLADTLRSFRP